MTGWEPATEAEAALRDALRVNDQELYFRVLSRLQLFLPVSADSLAGRAPMGWGTWSTGGRTHVLAFTSPEAMQICLGGTAASAREMRYSDLAAVWPSADWWLAVNPGLPIEGYLPSWFVGQLARGDSRMPGQETPAPPVRARAAVPAAPQVADRTAGGRAVDDGSRDPVGAAQAPLPPAPPTETGRVDQVEPVSPGIAGAMPGWRGTAPTNAGEGPNGLPRRRVPSRAVPEAPTQLSTAKAVRQPAPAPSGAVPPTRSPAPTDGEDERRAAMGPAQAPARADSTVHVGPARPDVTTRIDPGRADATTHVGPARADVTTRIDPARADATTQVDPARAAFTARIAPPAPPASAGPEFTPANDVEASLLAAADSGSTDSFLSTLLLATVALPVAPGSAPGARPGDPGFVWRTESLDGERYVVVFTSPARLVEHLGSPVDTVAVRFVQLIRRWPDREWSFAVNPGSPVGAKLPGPEIVALANWAAEVGLGDDADEPDPPAGGNQPGPPARPQPAPPTIMQKAIMPAHVGYYLERGYDRISGFVHRANEVAHLTSPAALFAALGLIHPNSPFSPHAPEVYVVRWPVHGPGLYRIPYGGQNESAMRAMKGWVIERAPFRGNGFAPGDSSDVIAEFKVDSVRLPHGAQLWRLGADGTETLVATLDSDVPRWRRVQEA